MDQGPADILLSDSGPQNCETTNFCWDKLSSVWHFVTAGLAHEYGAEQGPRAGLRPHSTAEERGQCVMVGHGGGRRGASPVKLIISQYAAAHWSNACVPVDKINNLYFTI